MSWCKINFAKWCGGQMYFGSKKIVPTLNWFQQGLWIISRVLFGVFGILSATSRLPSSSIIWEDDDLSISKNWQLTPPKILDG